MNRFIICLIGAFSLISLSHNAFAQSIEWVVKPVEMTVVCKSDGIIVVKDNQSQFGAYDYSGNVIFPFQADSITNVVNGASLVIMKEDEVLRLAGVISEAKYHSADVALYVGDYGYFSEDRLPVYNGNGLYGYVNKQARLMVPCLYEAVQPFTCEVAAVATSLPKNIGDGIAAGFSKAVTKLSSNNSTNRATIKTPQPVEFGSFSDKAKYTYVDKDGNDQKIVQNFKQVSYASPFVDGFALICSKGVFMRIDASMNLVKKTNSDDARNFYIDPNVTPASNTTFDTVLLPYSEGRLQGYKSGDNIAVLPQFDYAGYFSDGIAEVRIGNTVGLVKYCDYKYNIHLESSSVNPADDNLYRINVFLDPCGLSKDKEIKVVCHDGQKILTYSSVFASLDDGSRVYVLDIPKTTVRFRAESDGIVVWDDSMSDSESVFVSQSMLDNIEISLSARSVNADINDRAIFSVILKNREPVDIENIDVSVSGKDVLYVTKKISLPCGETVKVPTRIDAKQMMSSEKRSVSIKLSSPDGKYQTKKLINISVNPF